MREFTHTVGAVALGMPFMFRGRPRVRAGIERLASRRLGVLTKPRIDLRSQHFVEGGPIPSRFSAAGENVSPNVEWDLVPLGTRSLALLVEDPDAPTPKPFVHWLLADLSPSLEGLQVDFGSSDVDQRVEGRNSTLTVGWAGCAPPRRDVAHHYHFQLFALDSVPDLVVGFGRGELLDQIRGHVLAFGELVGTYRR